MSRLPNLLILGAQKAGTSWLHAWLNQHPDICMTTPKEVGLLLRNDPMPDYSACFVKDRDCRYWGDATPGYFWTPNPSGKNEWFRPGRADVAAHARAVLGPDVMLIISLRHPMERAVSAYIHHFRRGRIQNSEKMRDVAHKFGIIDIGHYKRHICSWEKEFSTDKFYYIFFDDVAETPVKVLRDLFKCLSLSQLDAFTGARKPINRGFRFRLGETAAIPDESHPSTKHAAERMELDGLAVEQEDIDAILPLFEEDIKFVSEKFKKSRLNWERRRHLSEFVGPSASSIA